MRLSPIFAAAWQIAPVALLLVGCASPPAARAGAATPDALVDITWEWVSATNPTARITVEAPQRYTLLLQRDGEARVRFDCNRGGAIQLVAGGAPLFTIAEADAELEGVRADHWPCCGRSAGS